jgi:hypothetical protein
MKGTLLFIVAVVALGVALASTRTEAHKPITSPFTYNEDVFPIVRDRCGRCHVSGGVAPMSLLAYKDMVPWGESIRAELVAGHMPPWSVIGGHGRFKNTPILSARELNVLLTWVTGGTPAGNPDHAPAPVAIQRDWPLGPPDLVLPLPSEVTLPADMADRMQEFTVRTGEANARWVRAVDLLPGTPAIVRSATITIKSDSSTSAAGGIDRERMLSLWVPGEDPVSLDHEAAFQLPPGAELIVRVHYKKTWEYERMAMTDRSAVGLYFATGAAPALGALTLTPPPDSAPHDGGQLSFSRDIAQDLKAFAVFADRELVDADVVMEAVRPDGTRSDIIRFHPRADWSRRFWFAQPIALPRGSRVNVVVTAAAADVLEPGAAPAAKKSLERSAVRLTLDVVPGL